MIDAPENLYQNRRNYISEFLKFFVLTLSWQALPALTSHERLYDFISNLVDFKEKIHKWSKKEIIWNKIRLYFLKMRLESGNKFYEKKTIRLILIAWALTDGFHLAHYILWMIHGYIQHK